MFIRFVCPKPIGGLAAREGFFGAAYDLRRSATIDQYSYDRVVALLEWYREHLPIPDKFNKTSSKGAYRRDTKGLSWFKPSASEMLANAFDLVALLEENGYSIEILKSDRIGYVIYEDEFQIVAEPFSDTPT